MPLKGAVSCLQKELVAASNSENSCLGRCFAWYLQGWFRKGGVILVNWFRLCHKLLEGDKSWGWVQKESKARGLGPCCLGKAKPGEGLIPTHPGLGIACCWGHKELKPISAIWCHSLAWWDLWCCVFSLPSTAIGSPMQSLVLFGYHICCPNCYGKLHGKTRRKSL